MWILPIYILCILQFIYSLQCKRLLKSSLPPDIVNKVCWTQPFPFVSKWFMAVFTTAELSSGGRDQYDLKIFTVWTFINIVFQPLNYNTISYWWIFTLFPVWGLRVNNVSLNLCNLLTYMQRSLYIICLGVDSKGWKVGTFLTLPFFPAKLYLSPLLILFKVLCILYSVQIAFLFK